MQTILLALLISLLAVHKAAACSQVYTHNRGRGLAEGPTCSYNHARAGRDWADQDEQCGWTCSGSSQSPINVPTTRTKHLKSAFKANLKFGVARNISVLNLGHAVQVEFNSPTGNQASVVYYGDSIYTLYNASSTSARKAHRVHVEPLQFHFHATSEHLLSGRSTELELHLVAKLVKTPGVPLPKECPTEDTTCLAVFGVMYDLTTDPAAKKEDKLVQDIIDMLPTGCNEAGRTCVNNDPDAKINLADLLPNKKYYTYTGSLTTPPCTEGVMWHVFRTVKRVLTQKQALDLQLALSTANLVEGEEERNRVNNRETQPRNGRTVFFST